MDFYKTSAAGALICLTAFGQAITTEERSTTIKGTGIVERPNAAK